MERVKEGKWYWYISINCEGVSVNSKIDTYCVLDNKNFESHNYFKTKEEAESMAKKICKVLNGADVIEMPSEDEIHEIAELDEINYVMHNSQKPESRDEWFRIGFKRGINWNKSKIVK